MAKKMNQFCQPSCILDHHLVVHAETNVNFVLVDKDEIKTKKNIDLICF